MISNIEVIIALIFLLLGLPHGTYDWILVPKSWNHRPSSFDLAVVSIFYLAISVPYFIVWIVWPKVALTIFFIATMLHWGQEELYNSIVIQDIQYKTNIRKLALILGRGGATVILPLLYYKKDYIEVVNVILGLFNSSVENSMIFEEITIFIMSLFVLVMLISHSVLSISENKPIDVFKDILLNFTIVAWFILCPVFISIPVYLAVKHSGIHMDRVKGCTNTSTKELIRLSMPYTFGSVPIILGLIVITSPSSLLGYTSVYIVFLSIVTIPHAIINTHLDISIGLY